MNKPFTKQDYEELIRINKKEKKMTSESNHIEDILAERGKTHGDFTKQAGLTQLLEAQIAKSAAEEDVNLDPVMRESIHMICHKLARIATGNPSVKDHWDDIAGYAKLVSDRL